MKKLLIIALAGLLTFGAAAPALALGPLDAEAELPVYSKYVWRGMVNVDDYVLQPSASLSLMGFKAGFWGNVDLTDFPQIDDSSTSELYLSAKVNVILSPSLVIYQDLDAIKGGYWDFNIGHDFALGETAKLNLSGGVGLGSQSYMEGYFTGGGFFVPDTDFGTSATDARVRAAIPFHPIPFFTITPSVTWTTLLGDAKDAVDGNEAIWYGKKDAFYWGLAAGFSF